MDRIQSPAQAFAETAAYAAAQEPMLHVAISQNIGRIAMHLYLGENARVVFGANRNSRIIMHDEFDAFMRNTDEGTQTDIAFLTNKIEAYAPLHEAANNALRQPKQTKNGFLGAGANGYAFRFNYGGTVLVAKSGSNYFDDAQAFRRAEHINSVSHLVAISLENQTTIMTLVPGDRIDKLSFSERMSIPDEHIKSGIEKSLEVRDEDLFIDFGGINYLYDTTQGFGIIDYSVLNDRTRHLYAATRASHALGLSGPLSYLPSKDAPRFGSEGYPEWALQHSLQKICLLTRFLDVMETSFQDLLEQAAAENRIIRSALGTETSNIIYNTQNMPRGEPFDAFKERLYGLGLQ